MSRKFTNVPCTYSSLEDIQRGLLQHVRRFRKAFAESAARGPITLNPIVDVTSKPRKLGKADSRVDDLNVMKDQVTLLRSMSAQIVVNFADNPKAKAIKKNVDDLANDIEAKFSELRRALSDSAKKSVDSTTVSRNRTLIKDIIADLGNRVKEIKESYLVGNIYPLGRTGPVVVADVAYAVLQSLRGPDGYSHPNYFVIVAYPQMQSVNGEALAKMYLAVSPDFRTPDRIHWQASVLKSNDEVAQLRKLAVDLLAKDGVIGKSFPREVPIPRDRLKFAHDNVKQTFLRGNKIEVRLKDKKRLDDTANELRSQLAGIVRHVDPNNRDLIRMKLNRTDGIVWFVFSLPGKLRGRLIDSEGLMKIRKLLNLTETETQRIKTALENPE